MDWLLSKQGLLNSALIYLGIISEPLALLNTPIAVYIGIVYAYFPLWFYPSMPPWKKWILRF